MSVFKQFYVQQVGEISVRSSDVVRVYETRLGTANLKLKDGELLRTTADYRATMAWLNEQAEHGH